MDQTDKSRRKLLLTGASLLGTMLIPSRLVMADRKSVKRPNIVFILADDLGFADLSCYGRRDYETPNIDRLADEGLLMDQGYANSAVCSATRIALITGRYQYRLPAGLDEPLSYDLDLGLPPDHPTLPSLLQDVGYKTILIGKWHMGAPPEFGPLKSGYERFFGIYGGATDYFSHRTGVEPSDWGRLIDQDRLVDRKGYVTDIFGREAVSEIETAAEDERPFFLSLHFTAPHWPWQSPGGEALPEGKKMSHFDGGNLKIYKEMVRSLDKNVGLVLDSLDKAGVSDNTIVVFTSDNGGERFSDTWPLVGAKTELLEGGIRVPVLIRWPVRIKSKSTSNQAIISMDFLPTLLAAAGGEPDPAYVPDGENLLPELLGDAPSRSRRLFWRYRAEEQIAMRDGDWKYLKIAGNEYLFNLSKDQRERANLSAIHPERFESMKTLYAKWNEKMLPYTSRTGSHNVKQDKWVDRY